MTFSLCIQQRKMFYNVCKIMWIHVRLYIFDYTIIVSISPEADKIYIILAQSLNSISSNKNSNLVNVTTITKQLHITFISNARWHR